MVIRNIVFGLCGESKRFYDEGYIVPKYLIHYNNLSMLEHSVKTLRVPGDLWFVVKEKHLQEFDFLESFLHSLGGKIITCNKDTGGAAETLLLTEGHIDEDKPLLSVNCDQYMRWDESFFINSMVNEPDTCWLPTFKANNPSYSYVKTDENGLVTDIKEKEVISNDATVGIYHWSKAKFFFRDAKQMIADGYKENNEYYIAPVYKYSIKNGLTVRKFEVKENEFWPVGTPEELKAFKNNGLHRQA